MTLPNAISAMLIYRLVSWIFISAIGWLVFFVMFRTEGALDPEIGVEELATQELAEQELADQELPNREGRRDDPNPLAP